MDSGVIDFGKALLDNKDLDPIYDYLAAENRPYDHLRRWMVAYSMFYHAGVANYLAPKANTVFWTTVLNDMQPWPRGEERRHFRGKQALRAAKYMSQYRPEDIVNSWFIKPDFRSVAAAVRTIPIYGPWIAFKLADMGERVLRLPIDFSNCTLGIYKEPRAGAALVVHGDDKARVTEAEIEQAVEYITSTLNNLGYKAPPWYDRPLNVQEAETILCKYKSHKHGHYPVGKDIEAVAKALAWGTP